MIKIILSAFNEAQNIQKLIPSIIHQFELMQREFEIIFCLDCSTDNSIEIIESFKNQCQITILPIENHRGLGIAFKKIFLHNILKSKSDDILISFDADCTHNPSQIPEMIKIFESQNLDFMVASRFVNQSSTSHFPFHRKFISKSISIFLQILFPIYNRNDKTRIKDYTSGYRIYKNSILQELHKKLGNNIITEKDFTFQIEILVKLNKHQLIKKFAEYPIKYEYGSKIGPSKLRLYNNFYRLIILCFKLLN